MKVEFTFTEPLLGTWPMNRELASEFIASKYPQGIQPDEERAIESLDEAIDKSSTGFVRDEKGRPFLFDYQIRGFLKEACAAMLDMDTMSKEELKKLKLTWWSYKRTLDHTLFVRPRKIYLEFPTGQTTHTELIRTEDGKVLGDCERPLLAETLKGKRTALAKSEAAPINTKITCTIIVLKPALEPFVKPWLDYGAFLGMGQWRNSGCGRFDWVEIST